MKKKWIAFNSIVGVVRKKNEDKINCFFKDNIKIFIICDGMGGHPYGEFAAKYTIEKFEEKFFKFNFLTLKNHDQYFNWLIDTVKLIKNEMYKIAQKDYSKFDMGTTLSVCLNVNNNLYIVNIGDCRVYLFLKAKLIQATVDQNLLNAKEYKFLLKGSSHTMQKLLISALGPNKQTNIDTYFFKDFNGFIILTSDGFHDFVKFNEFYDILIKYSDNLKKCCNYLIDKALKNNSNDNISVLIAKV